MYVSVGALDEARRAEFTKLMPRCYTQEFADCWHEEDTSAYPNCDQVNALWKQDKPYTEQVVDDMPYCSSAKMRQDKIIWAAGAAVVGMLLGVLIG